MSDLRKRRKVLLPSELTIKNNCGFKIAGQKNRRKINPETLKTGKIENYLKCMNTAV